MHDRVVPFEEGWRWQKALVEETISGGTDLLGSLIILQHDPVYTLGEGSTLDNLRFDVDNPPHPLFRIERGGEVTYHGPGQLVMYPILNLKLLQTDLHWYLRNLEQIIIACLENVSGITADRIQGLTGVWVGNQKVAAIGIRATKWVTYHGLALNVTTNIDEFECIIPCGIEDKSVTSVHHILHQKSIEDDCQYVPETISTPAEDTLLLEYSYGLQDAFSHIFGIDMDDFCVVSGQDAIDELNNK
eukprot:jgi/Picre1/30920/NNA_006279.t1